jgi:polysaccharide deacetylase family protein (PEP-CTERM system associated)
MPLANSTRLVFTLDLEEHRPDDSFPKRYPEITYTLLEFLERRKIEATVFVLGRIVRDDPKLIQEISSRGHEIAYHSVDHVHLTVENPDRFRNQATEYKKKIEDLIGKPLQGYRAPAFSLTRESLWAVETLQELGFTYSSSVMPAKNPVYGFPGAPMRPFKWPNGLLEIPAPVARCGPMTIPFLGGFYLRYLPNRLIQKLLKNGAPEQCYWAYCHPYDFDHKERFFRIDGTSLLVSALLWFNRRHTFEKLESIFPLTGDGQRSFASLIAAGEFDDAIAYRP